MMLTLLVAGLAIGCSSATEAPAAPAAPVPNLSENEAIAIARSSESHYPWWSTRQYGTPSLKKTTSATVNLLRLNAAEFG